MLNEGGKLNTPTSLGQKMMDREGIAAEAVLASLSWKTPEDIDRWRDDYLLRKGSMGKGPVTKGGYQDYCWKCTNEIDSGQDVQCPKCKRYKCKQCGHCLCDWTKS